MEKGRAKCQGGSMKHLPAFKAALIAAAGIVTGRLLQEYSVVLLSGGVVLLLISGSWFLLQKGRMTTSVTIVAYAALFLSFAFYMSINLASLSEIHPDDYRVYAGTVDEVSPDTSKPSIVLTSCYGYDNAWQKIHGDLVLSPKSPLMMKTGDRIVFTGKPGTLSLARNPGQFNLRNYYRLNGIAGRIFLRNADDIISIQHEGGFSFHRYIIQPIRNFVAEKTSKFLAGDVSGLARAMVLGERTGINREMNENFMNSGTIHILSVSGLHIGFLTGILMALASITRIPRRWRFFLIAPVLVIYAYVVGMSPSVLRAVIMARLI
ncbi:MAG: ComEC/Rec2 family competence protein, partial [Bacteroidetes bacterium]|nr:ComEC/Rec2 family competence protein [Bacteroidota bacterium]